MQDSCHFCLLSCLSGWTVLDLEGGDLENQQTLQDPFSLHDHVHRRPSRCLNKTKSVLKFRIVILIFFSYSHLSGTRTLHLMVTAAKSTPNLHSPNQFLLVSMKSVRSSALIGSSITCIISALHKPKLLVSCSLPFQQVSGWLNNP